MMNQNNSLRKMIGLAPIVLFLLACGLLQNVSTPTPVLTATPVPPTPTPVPPTATPIPPTPTPAMIPGINEPVVLEDVRVKDFLGNTWTTDIQIRLLDAYMEVSLESGEETISPSDLDNTFLVIDFELSGQSGSVEWTARNATLTCGETEYKVDMSGLEAEEGKIKAWQLVFEVPQDADFGQCVFRLEEYAIELVTFFE